MAKKYIICNNHGDRIINKYTEKKIAFLYEKNPDITCLIEGISDAELDQIGDSTKIDYSNLEPEQVMYMPFTELILAIKKSGMQVKGAENVSPEGNEPLVATFQDFCKELMSYEATSFTNSDKERDKSMLKNFNDFEGSCVFVIGSSHVLHWLKQGDLSKLDVEVIYPGHDNEIKRALDAYNLAFQTKICYEPDLGKQIHHEMYQQLIDLGATYIDLTKDDLDLNGDTSDSILDFE